MPIRRLVAAFLAASLALLPAAAQQAAQTYNIELVIFRAASASGGAENWSAERAQVNAAGEGESASGSAQVGRLVRTLPGEQFQLNDVAGKLRSTGTYVPVAHAAWSQTASAWGARSGLSLDKLGLNVAGLSGTVSLERGQYLHLNLALSYSPASPPTGLGAEAGTTFTINENRRVRFYERNYYDHPAFGVIALVTPTQGARPAGR